MKNVLFGILGVASLAGLVACGAPTANSTNEGSEAPMDDISLEAAPDPATTDDRPMNTPAETPVDATTVSDRDLEMIIRDNLATLYPETTFDVTALAGAVTIAGAIPTQEEADYIADWVAEIEGVTDVEVMPSEGTTDL